MENRDNNRDSSNTNKDVKADIDDIKDETNKDIKKDAKTINYADRNMKADIDEVKNSANKDTKDIKSNNSAELDSFVKKMHYPAKKQEIIDTAKKGVNGDKITNVLQKISEKYYSSADELNREIALIA